MTNNWCLKQTREWFARQADSNTKLQPMQECGPCHHYQRASSEQRRSPNAAVEPLNCETSECHQRQRFRCLPLEVHDGDVSPGGRRHIVHRRVPSTGHKLYRCKITPNSTSARRNIPGFGICTPRALEVRRRFSCLATKMRFHAELLGVQRRGHQS